MGKATSKVSTEQANTEQLSSHSSVQLDRLQKRSNIDGNQRNLCYHVIRVVSRARRGLLERGSTLPPCTPLTTIRYTRSSLSTPNLTAPFISPALILINTYHRDLTGTMDVDMEIVYATPPTASSHVPVVGLKRRRSDSVDDQSTSSSLSPLDGDATDSPHRTKRRLLSPVPTPTGAAASLTDLQTSSLDLYVRASFKPYWFDEGDVMLVVSDHLFQLPRKLLACSEIFEDMFCLAQPGDDRTRGEKVPVVHLDDKPQDWMLLLQWIEDSECVFRPSYTCNIQRALTITLFDRRFWLRREVTYEVLAGVLRLSTKYEIPKLRSSAVRRLHRMWPTDVRKMGAPAFTPQRVDGITLARQCDLPQVLPAIFYSLAIEYEAFQTFPEAEMNLYDLDGLRHGVAQLRKLLERTYENAMRLGDCSTCRQTLAAYWDRELRATGEHLPGRVAQGTWLLRLCMDMFEGEVPPVDGDVCEQCLGVHWQFVDHTQQVLVGNIPAFFGCK
ncbi:hypothetical protein OF83DRAFT_385199 [Amylostereum chailletii]|nr:hypothetical protein OF83DRAFT_385199 [Amylostereum chailletii]